MATNALIHEKSPYLKQHASNPVDWLPWGEAAFTRARSEDKPIFLSIGYSTCHWCHVMAHESFEDERIAAQLNRDFVCIKVDREERPDVDRIYMLFVQATSGSGGWPMSVFLTPQLKPFFGGTYFPPGPRYGRPGFSELLNYLAETWKKERSKIEESGASVTDQLRQMSASAQTTLQPDRSLFGAAYNQFRRMYDPRHGGFGAAPKFPRPVVLNYLLRYYKLEGEEEALDMVAATLSAMQSGGMHDQLGGGFHRYSVDERWFVPHFEKMLYDQSQLAISYLEAFQITRQESFAAAARGILGYVQRDLTDAEGGFYSAEDADSPDPENPSHSGEGSFYIWKKSEIDTLLGDASPLFCKHFGVEAEGNVEHDPHGEFGGRNILFVADFGDAGSSLSTSKTTLFEARSKRPRPHLDSKILTSWNGLMISAFVKAHLVLGDGECLKAAQRAAHFVLARMYTPETGELKRRFCEGEAAVSGFLDDYAFFCQALLDLFEATAEASYLKVALELAAQMTARFEDVEAGGFFSTEAGVADLLLRMKDDYDGAEPSGNSVATQVLIRLSHLTAEPAFLQSAEKSLQAFAPKMKAQPTMAPQMLCALESWLSAPEHLIVRVATEADLSSEEVKAQLRRYRDGFQPNVVSMVLTDKAAAALGPISRFLGALERHGQLTIYHCENFACELPQVMNLSC
jgi:uncharacterized protein YyaL (SSP411 family)